MLTPHLIASATCPAFKAIQKLPLSAANICGFISKKDAFGKTARTVSKKVSAEFSINHNQEVIKENSIKIKDEHFERRDGFNFRDIAIKFPWYNQANKMIGVFGCSIVSGDIAPVH